MSRHSYLMKDDNAVHAPCIRRWVAPINIPQKVFCFYELCSSMPRGFLFRSGFVIHEPRGTSDVELFRLKVSLSRVSINCFAMIWISILAMRGRSLLLSRSRRSEVYVLVVSCQVSSDLVTFRNLMSDSARCDADFSLADFYYV